MVTEAIQTLPEAVIAKLPSLKNMATTIRSKKRRVQAPLPNPQTLAELELPDDLILTQREEAFLIYDSGSADESRILVFGTLENLEILGGCKIWAADGTFKVCPSLFKQLWVIHGHYRGNVLAVI